MGGQCYKRLWTLCGVMDWNVLLYAGSCEFVNTLVNLQVP